MNFNKIMVIVLTIYYSCCLSSCTASMLHERTFMFDRRLPQSDKSSHFNIIWMTRQMVNPPTAILVYDYLIKVFTLYYQHQCMTRKVNAAGQHHNDGVTTKNPLLFVSHLPIIYCQSPITSYLGLSVCITQSHDH